MSPPSDFVSAIEYVLTTSRHPVDRSVHCSRDHARLVERARLTFGMPARMARVAELVARFPVYVLAYPPNRLCLYNHETCRRLFIESPTTELRPFHDVPAPLRLPTRTTIAEHIDHRGTVRPFQSRVALVTARRLRAACATLTGERRLTDARHAIAATALPVTVTQDTLGRIVLTRQDDASVLHIPLTSLQQSALLGNLPRIKCADPVKPPAPYVDPYDLQVQAARAAADAAHARDCARLQARLDAEAYAATLADLAAAGL